MIAAIYVRKSTDQFDVADEQKSVARQIDHARQYAARKGWTVDEASVFEDDGISGAEFAARPGYVRLMTALKPRPAFQVLIMSEESRLGREAIETAYALKQLVQAGVRIFFYLEDRERTLDSPTDKIMLSLTTFADELEREKARQRTYDAMLRKARAGHVTGGRVFGYDNVEVLAADGSRSHVVRRINEAEAVVVRRIFESCRAGDGLTRITKALNDDRMPAPRPQQGRAAGWAGSTVREVLLRPLYRGEIVWNQTRKRDAWGQTNRRTRAAGDWMRIAAPQLRIVSEELWQAAQARFVERQTKYTAVGRHRKDIESPYLLSGFARCGTCGGSLSVISRQHGGKRVRFYGCAASWKRGSRVCANNMIARQDVLEEEVLATLQDDVCRPAVIEEAIRLAIDALSPEQTEKTLSKLESDRRAARTDCERLAIAIEQGGALGVLLERLQVAQGRLDAIEGELRATEAKRAPSVDLASLRGRLREKLDDWRGLLRRNVGEARGVLRALLIGPLRFTPVTEERRRGYAFDGRIALDRLLSGVIDLSRSTTRVQMPPLVASPAGTDEQWAHIVEGFSDLKAA
jgi:site-specific DNA recombinase